MELLVGDEIMTFVEYLTDEALKSDLRYLTRRSLLLLFEGSYYVEELVTSSFAKIMRVMELGRRIIEYL